MAAITPQTDVYLLKVPLEIDDENQLTFSDATAQFNYFNGLSSKLLLDNFTYQRKDGVIRVPYCIDDIMQYNYVMYRNEGFSNKWFYAYITGMEFLNPNTTAISIRTDVFQTWQFQLTYKQTFVEREHTNNDTVGANTVPENLEVGEYVVNGDVIDCDLSPTSTPTNNTWICFQVSDYPDGNGALTPSIADDVKGIRMNGVYTGLAYLFVLTEGDANDLIKCYTMAGKPDAIVAIFQIPLGVVTADNSRITNYTNTTVGTISIGHFITSSLDPVLFDTISVTKPATLSGYTPKNNKMLTYPYTYFYVSNNAGTDATYHWEDFSSNPSFNVDGAICQGMSIRAYPTNYKNTTGKGGYNYGVVGGKLPVCAWASDYYTNWVTQNAVNIGTGLANGLIGAGLGLVGGLITHNPMGIAGGIAGGISAISNVLAANYQASITPDQARGATNSGDLNVSEVKFGFTVYPMSVKAEYARICDEFFSRFGYKTLRVKTPNVTGRVNWNYVKTIDCYIEADIPQDDLQEIKNLFDKGITFWHNPSTFCDYSQSNGIVTP